jgi:hypothetical protein
VLVRVSSIYRMEMNIDADEDNGAALEPGSTGRIVGIMEAGTAKGRTMFSRVAYYLSKKEFVKSAIAEQVDLSVFKQNPGFRIYAGLLLIALSYILGWPAVALLGIISYYADNKLIFVIGGPSIYGFSWLLLIGGLWLAGAEYSRNLSRWFARLFVERYLRN